MSSANVATRAPRVPPTRQRGGNPATATATATATAHQGSTGASETQLRRRLAEVEMRLRDTVDDAKRLQLHQEQELATLERDNAALRERLEELRMEECMTATEARAAHAHVQLTQSAPKGERSSSKLLGGTSLKYLEARAQVKAKRRECAHTEWQLSEVRQQLSQLRQRRRDLRQHTFAVKASAGARMAAAERYKVQVREQLRGLEEQVAREQERFSNMVTEAKSLRATIDAQLINQASSDKMYRTRYDVLLDKKKEMAYLMEVCNLLCEERQLVTAELAEVQAHLTEESEQYETAFQELSGVSDENAKVRTMNQEKMEELRRLIAQTRAEREALEAENNEQRAAIERRRHRSMRRRQQDDSASVHSPASRHAALDEVGSNGNESSAFERSGVMMESQMSGEDVSGLDGQAGQLKEFETYFDKLAYIVQSDAIEDVVGFPDVAADERYKCFDEMNALKQNITALQAEKAQLTAQLRTGGGPTTGVATGGATAVLTLANPKEESPNPAMPATSPTASLVALAEVNSINALTAAAGSASVKDAAKSLSSQEGGTAGSRRTPSPAAGRAERMRRLQADLDDTRDTLMEQEQQKEECEHVLAQVIAQVNEAFKGLGCSVEELRSITGLEGVQQSTLLQCLALVEQRAEEYLIAYSRVQHQQSLEQQQQLLQPSAATAHVAARTILRRPDLLPRVKGGIMHGVIPRQLPRSTDIAAAMPSITLDASNTLEDLVEERPLTEAELKEVVEAKRAMARR